jgi:PucR C-terminal helix-turn-helix domain/GGDEF-like domain
VEQTANPDVARAVATLGSALLGRTDQLAAEMTERIQAAAPVYTAGIVSTNQLRATCKENVEFIFSALGSEPATSSPQSRENGRARARAGVPLPAVMAAYRVTARYLWEKLAAAACDAGVSASVIVAAASEMWLVLDVFTSEMADGYREEITAQSVVREQQRSSLVQAILHGELVDTSLWEAAEILRIPTVGPYVVVAAEVPELGRLARPLIGGRLSVSGMASAWGVTHELEVGIVTVRMGQADVDQLERELARSHTGSAGISPVFHALSESSEGLRLARIALRASTTDHPVTLFDRRPLAIAAVAAPDIMRRLAEITLVGLQKLPENNRRVLLDTVGAWLTCGGSAERAGENLFCHPNTVRYRLRRFAHYTGHDFDDPQWIAQVVLAYNSYRSDKLWAG